MLTGRVALVTGASRGLGRAVAEAFVRAGASVALVARPSPGLEEVFTSLTDRCCHRDQRLHAIRADLTRHEDCVEVVRTSLREFGSVDILVNNAGVTGPIGPLEQVDVEAWRRTLAINLVAPVTLMREVIPQMCAREWGKIINLSGGGAAGPRSNFSAYAASKAALVRVTETVAQELSGRGVDVNAVAPGAMNTRMLDDVLEAGAGRGGEGEYRRALEQQARGGPAMERAAELIVWLASPASDGITGRLISAVWDSWRDLAARRDELNASDVYTLRRIVPEDRGKDWGRGR
jgi:NAD(P)-dependent dehydrogenase (short-subunit alcohol dehydrogenase family)